MGSYFCLFTRIERIVLLLYFFDIVQTLTVDRTTQNVMKKLTLNFYVNLQNQRASQTVGSQNEIQIRNYVNKFHETVLRRLRNVDTDRYDYPMYGQKLYRMSESDIYPFETFREHGFIKTRLQKDFTMFSHKNSNDRVSHLCTAFVLGGHDSEDNELQIYQYTPKSSTWQSIYSQKVFESSRLKSLPISSGTLLVAANGMKNNTVCNSFSIFLFDDNNRLKLVQSLKTNLFNDFALWESSQNIYLMAAIESINTEDPVDELNPLYVWKENYFNVFQLFDISDIKRVVPFQIGFAEFIGVARHNNNYGEEQTYSEMFKFDSEIRKFISIQKLATNAAIDIEFFGFQWSTFAEPFIIITNEYKSKQNLDNDHSMSIIYKFENGIFMPFQNLQTTHIIKWLPLVGSNGEFLLVGITKNNKLKIFQYNGWLFVDTFYDFDKLNYIPVDASIKKFRIDNDPVLTITYVYNGEAMSVFYKPFFKVLSPIKEINLKINKWCEKVKETLSCSGNEYFKSKSTSEYLIEKLDKNNQIEENNNDSDGKKILEICGSQTEVIETNSIYSDNFHFNKNIVQNINNLMNSFYSHLSSMKSLKEIIVSTIRKEDKVIMNSTHIHRLNLKCISKPCHLNKILLQNINGKKVEEYQNKILYVTNGLSKYKKIVIDDVVVKSKLSVDKINKKPMDNIKKIILSTAESMGVVVKGTVFMDKGFSLSGKIQKVRFNDNEILLKIGNQQLKDHFVIPKLKSFLLEADKINDIGFQKLRSSINSQNKTLSLPHNLAKVTVDDVILEKGGNDINIQEIKDFALKLSGKKIFHGNCSIGNLKANRISLNIEQSKTDVFENIIKIHEGQYKVNQDLHLSRMIVKNLAVKRRLSNVPILNGKMDVLLLNSSQNQRVTGDKIFENVELMGPINLVGRINRGTLERKNPVTMIEEPLRLTGDYIILGNVSIESLVSCENLINGDDRQSIKQLQQRGLKLTDSQIDVPLVFAQPLEAKHVECNNVNEMNPLSWIANNNEDFEVTGRKVFLDDLEIVGNCTISDTINKVKPSDLNNIFRTVGNQEIDGDIFIANVTSRSLNCNRGFFGEKSLQNILSKAKNFAFSGEINITKMTIVYQNMDSSNITLHGKIDEWNIIDVVSDTILNNGHNIEINTEMSFKEIFADGLLTLSKVPNIEIDKINSAADWNKEIFIKDSLYIDKLTNIQKSKFGISIVGISKADFGYNWLLSKSDQTIRGKLRVNVLSCIQDLFIENTYVNNVDILNTYRNAVWMNEYVQLQNIIFLTPPRISFVTLDGSLNNIKSPQSFILKSSDDMMRYVKGYKKVKKNIFSDQTIFSPFICGIPLEKFCLMIPNDNYFIANWVITGNLFLRTEPRVNMLHNKGIAQLLNYMWFSDNSVDGFMQNQNYFKTIIFKDRVVHKGLLNKFDLNLLQYKYISLTTNQMLTRVYHFKEIYSDLVIVGSETVVIGYLNDVQFEDFYFNALQTHGNQDIKNFLQFSSILGNIKFKNTINGLNIANDILKVYGMPNTVKGYKVIIGPVTIANMFSVFIQNIDFPYWINYSVKKSLLSTDFSLNTKMVDFVKINNLRILRTLNGESTNFITNTKQLQVLSGKITFYADIAIKNMFISQLLNGIPFIEKINNLIYKVEDSCIIMWPKEITSSITAENVIIEGFFNKSFFYDITNAISGYDTYNYYKSNLANMIDNSGYLHSELHKHKGMSIFDTETVQFIPGDIRVFEPIKLFSENYLTIVIKNVNYEIQFLKWNAEFQQFVKDAALPSLFLNEDVIEMYKIKYGNLVVFYIEAFIASKTIIQKNGYIFTHAKDSFIRTDQIVMNDVMYTVPLQKDELSCLLFIYSNSTGSVYCLDNKLHLQLRQRITIPNASVVQILNVSNMTYLILKMPSGISILHWTKTGEITILQQLPPATEFTSIVWNNECFLGVIHFNVTSIYKFNNDIQRFTEIQSMKYKNVENIKLNHIRETQLILTMLMKKSASYDLICYQLEGLSGFQIKFIYPLSISFMKNIKVMADDNVFIIAITLSNGISVLKNYFIN